MKLHKCHLRIKLYCSLREHETYNVCPIHGVQDPNKAIVVFRVIRTGRDRYKPHQLTISESILVIPEQLSRCVHV